MRRTLLLGIILGLMVPFAGTLILNNILPGRAWVSLPLHATLEVAGAAVGLVLATLMLASRQTAHTSRTMWIACALIGMGVLDLFHGAVPPGASFVWLHNLASLAGGILFALVWFPEREVSRRAALGAGGAALAMAILVGAFCAAYPESLPAATEDGGFASATITIQLLGGGLFILAAINFAVRYARTRQLDELLFLIVCFLFGVAELLSPLSSLWSAGWWFWHVLRFGGYLLAFCLAMLSYRSVEDERIRAHSELDSLFHAAVDGKRIVDRQFNQRQTNDTFVVVSGVAKETAEKMKCHEVLGGPLCGTDECPIRQFEAGVTGAIEREVTKTRMDGKEVSCILKAIPLTAPNGSFRGIIESFFDITERKRAEEALARQTRLVSAINKIFREALTCESEEDVGRTALRVAEELTGSRFGIIGEINAAGLFDTIAISNPGWETCDVIVSDAKNFIKNMPIRGIDRSALREGKSRIVNADQIATHPDRVGTPAGHPPITCFLGVPFKQGEKTVGMIGLGNKEGGYNQEDQEAIEALSVAFYEALLRKRLERQVQEQAALKTGQAELSDQMRGNLPADIVCCNIITFLCKRLQAPTGLMYLAGEDGTLRLAAGYAHKRKGHVGTEYRPGEGLVGQAALEGKDIILADVPENYFTIESGLGETVPRNVYIKPIAHNGGVKAVIELGTLREFDESQSQLLNAVAESIAVAVESAHARATQARSLEKSRRLSEELRSQQEELRASNEELEEQTQALKLSEEKLKAQQEELQVTNEELEEKNDLLERQKREVERARQEIEDKAQELAVASKYKSEFLANMSHELRSPLNSLLLLAQSLAENKAGNLSAEQVESSRVIHSSGNDLLNLINEILDLSKIEAGRMDLRLGPVRSAGVADAVRASFQHLAADKGLDFEVTVIAGAPESIVTDRQRFEQVLRNLVSNAIKFTDQGRVTVTFSRAIADLAEQTSQSQIGARKSEILEIAVSDTGIGIAPEQHKRVFEAFQQADGGITRRHGGTGLGLSIARELTRLLGGEIRLESEPGKGSTFTLYLPTERGAQEGEERRTEKKQDQSQIGNRKLQIANRQFPIADDRSNLEKGDRVILVIEDDASFAKVLCDKCHERDFKCLAAPTGEEGLELADTHVPSAVILDIRLPGMDGWAVLSALKESTRTRHIPVHVVSVEQASTEALRKGAVGHATKPLDQEGLAETFRRLERAAAEKPRRILVVEDDPKVRRETVKLIGNGDVKVDEAGHGEQAMEALRSDRYDCVVLDLNLPDMDALELLERLEREGVELPPVIVHTARDLTREEEMELREHAESIVIKDVRSQERLLDEVSLFLHRVVSRMPEGKRQIIRDLHDTDALLKDKKVLIVDDDMRATFALARLLSERGMRTLKAENGQKALDLLAREPDVDIVLMDIMMPVMDGLEAIRRIRALEGETRKVPIIALTAKAMRDDREKCLAAGASDYMSKPVDQERLISMMRVWLYR